MKKKLKKNKALKSRAQLARLWFLSWEKNFQKYTKNRNVHIQRTKCFSNRNVQNNYCSIIVILDAVQRKLQHCRYTVTARTNLLQVQPLERKPRSRVKDKDSNETHRAPVSAILPLLRKMHVDASLWRSSNINTANQKEKKTWQVKRWKR